MFLLKELQCNVRIYAGYLRLLHSFLCSEDGKRSQQRIVYSRLALWICELFSFSERLKTKLRPVNKDLSEETLGLSVVHSVKLITVLRHSWNGAFARLGHRADLFPQMRTHDSAERRPTQRNIFQNVTPVSCHLFSE